MKIKNISPINLAMLLFFGSLFISHFDGRPCIQKVNAIFISLNSAEPSMNKKQLLPTKHYLLGLFIPKANAENLIIKTFSVLEGGNLGNSAPPKKSSYTVSDTNEFDEITCENKLLKSYRKLRIEFKNFVQKKEYFGLIWHFSYVGNQPNEVIVQKSSTNLQC